MSILKGTGSCNRGAVALGTLRDYSCKFLERARRDCVLAYGVIPERACSAFNVLLGSSGRTDKYLFLRFSGTVREISFLGLPVKISPF